MFNFVILYLTICWESFIVSKLSMLGFSGFQKINLINNDLLKIYDSFGKKLQILD